MDSGQYSRFFDLDAWAKENGLTEEQKNVFPFLICPKPSKSEKNKGCENLESKFTQIMGDGAGGVVRNEGHPLLYRKNNHPTCKPLKLMQWLITLATRKGDTVLDPYSGSGTTGLACKNIDRKYILIEKEEEYCKIIEARLNHKDDQGKLF